MTIKIETAEYWKNDNEAPLPYGHVRLASGAMVDLTAITAPFGLLDAETQDALRKHCGPRQWWNGNNWTGAKNETLSSWIAYRVKPQPPAPVVGEVVVYGVANYDCDGFGSHKDFGDTHSLKLPTIDGKFVAGTYTGPGGLTIKVEALS